MDLEFDCGLTVEFGFCLSDLGALFDPDDCDGGIDCPVDIEPEAPPLRPDTPPQEMDLDGPGSLLAYLNPPLSPTLPTQQTGLLSPLPSPPAHHSRRELSVRRGRTAAPTFVFPPESDSDCGSVASLSPMSAYSPLCPSITPPSPTSPPLRRFPRYARPLSHYETPPEGSNSLFPQVVMRRHAAKAQRRQAWEERQREVATTVQQDRPPISPRPDRAERRARRRGFIMDWRDGGASVRSLPTISPATPTLPPDWQGSWRDDWRGDVELLSERQSLRPPIPNWMFQQTGPTTPPGRA